MAEQKTFAQRFEHRWTKRSLRSRAGSCQSCPHRRSLRLYQVFALYGKEAIDIPPGSLLELAAWIEAYRAELGQEAQENLPKEQQWGFPQSERNTRALGKQHPKARQARWQSSRARLQARQTMETASGEHMKR